ncbi:MAG: helix-turn-helix transcriptional regulator [Candidatus Kapabacteria bacterium]|nr:helix-turn-helix transcriptional regulator [Candidatus Kapabacteria bacterium]
MRYESDKTLHAPTKRRIGVIRTDVNGRLREVRDVLGLTNADIARGSGLTRAYISRVVNDQTNLGLDLLIFLSKEHAVSSDWLLTGKGTMFQQRAMTSVDMEALHSELRQLRDIVERYVAEPTKRTS